MANPDSTARISVGWTIVIVALALTLAAVVYLARYVLLLVYGSALLAVGLSPFVRWLQHRKWLRFGSRPLPRSLAIALLYLMMLAVSFGVALLILPTLVSQGRDFVARLPDIVDRSQGYLVARGILPDRMTFGEIVEQAPFGAQTVGKVLFTLWGVLGGLLGVVTILILTAYFLLESGSIFATFVRLFPRERREQVRAASAEVSAKVSAWLGGQLILAGVIGAVTAIGLAILGVPYFFVLAVIAAIGELIPYVGPFLAAIPAIAVAYTVSGNLALAAGGFLLIQQQFENHVLVPKLMQHQVGLSAITVIIALLVGGALLGVVGVILAVPTASILQVLFQELVTADEEKAQRSPGSSSRPGR